jgi:hypothetical protein
MTLAKDTTKKPPPQEAQADTPGELPPVRRLRVYAYDPQASTDRMTAAENIAVIALPWAESSPDETELSPGPVNNYVEVVDVDPVARKHYAPVDLNAAHVLAQDGLPPSEGNPQFHQQMVFAVVMKTIKLFEQALGRRVFWRAAWNRKTSGYTPVERLRIYPHGLREANAFYSIEKVALVFGYFQADREEAGANLPGGWVFTCLSHDIIVHETTHAILDGLQRRFAEATSVDTLAFHEAFADTVALLSRFTLSDVVAAQIARHRGRLNGSTLLSQIGRQVGEATGRGSSIRDAFDLLDGRSEPDKSRIASTTAPHARGAILVAAIFEAFVSIYETRTADLMRIAGLEGSTDGRSLHPDLVKRLAGEASKAATHLLRMCIRAIDYMPPVDPRFGDFLRGLITADMDLVPDDRLHYRLSVIQACRRRGIYPEGCRSLAPESLMWPRHKDVQDISAMDLPVGVLKLQPARSLELARLEAEENRWQVWRWLMVSEGAKRDRAWESALGVKFQVHFSPGLDLGLVAPIHSTQTERQKQREQERAIKRAKSADLLTSKAVVVETKAPPAEVADREMVAMQQLERSSAEESSANAEAVSGLLSLLQLHDADRRSGAVERSDGGVQLEPLPRVEVHSVRITRRVGPDGQDLPQLVVEITQRRRGFLDPAVQTEQDSGTAQGGAAFQPKPPDFWYRGGARLIIDLRSGRIRYIIRKAIDDEDRLARQRAFMTGMSQNALAMTYGLPLEATAPTGRGASTKHRAAFEPFALMHRGLI